MPIDRSCADFVVPLGPKCLSPPQRHRPPPNHRRMQPALTAPSPDLARHAPSADLDDTAPPLRRTKSQRAAGAPTRPPPGDQSARRRRHLGRGVRMWTGEASGGRKGQRLLGMADDRPLLARCSPKTGCQIDCAPPPLRLLSVDGPSLRSASQLHRPAADDAGRRAMGLLAGRRLTLQ
jgi:hypothetical protein